VYVAVTFNLVRMYVGMQSGICQHLKKISFVPRNIHCLFIYLLINLLINLSISIYVLIYLSVYLFIY
jgi:hypothetical protein